MELDTSSSAGFGAVCLLPGVLLCAVDLSVGDDVVELLVPILDLSLSGDLCLPAVVDSLSLLDDLVGIPPPWILLFISSLSSRLFTSFGLFVSVTSLVLSFTVTTSSLASFSVSPPGFSFLSHRVHPQSLLLP